MGETNPVLLNGERMLHFITAIEGRELTAISDGKVWRDLPSDNSIPSNVRVPYDEIGRFIASNREPSIFSYHSHTQVEQAPHAIFLYETIPIRGLSPFAPEDVAVHLKIKEMARGFGKSVVSRAVEKFGVWQYDAGKEDISAAMFARQTLLRLIKDSKLNGSIEEQLELVRQAYRHWDGLRFSFRPFEHVAAQAAGR